MERTEANEHNPSAARAYAAWQEQIAKGETMGVRQMYEDAFHEADRKERKWLSLRIEILECCCCGGGTRGRQWWNRDTGYGMCENCIAYVRSKGETEDQIRDYYGVEGIHWGTNLRSAKAMESTRDVPLVPVWEEDWDNLR